jgi:hypothetical protein
MLRDETLFFITILFSIVVAFTIHSTNGNSPPLHGVMTNYGYALPDPNVSNRFTIFFTGGLLEPNDETDLVEWKKVFGVDAPKRSLADRARLLAAKILLGANVSDTMEVDGSMSYYLKRPIGGHGSTYMDVSIRITELSIVSKFIRLYQWHSASHEIPQILPAFFTMHHLF